MIRLLSDEDIQTDILYDSVIGRNRRLIRALGWADASLVEQYNLLVSLGVTEQGIGQNIFPGCEQSHNSHQLA